MLMMNEWRYAIRQPLVWLCMVTPVVFGIILAGGLATADIDIIKQFQLNLVALQMMSLPLLVGVLAPIILLRDTQHNMQELVMVTPVSHSKRDLLRLAMLVLLASATSIVSVIGMMLFHMTQLDIAMQFITTSLLNIAVVILPNTLFLSVIGLLVCENAPNAVVNYVIFASVWLGYLVLASITGNPILAGSSVVNISFYRLFQWLDPFAFTAILSQFAEPQWHINNIFIANRIAVIIVSSLLLFLVVRTSAHTLTKRAQGKGAPSSEISSFSKDVSYHVTPTRKVGGIAAGRLYKTTLLSLLSSRVTQLIVCIWPMLIFNAVASSTGYAEPFAVMSATSQDAVNYFAFDVLPLLGTFLLVLWSWQVCTRDKLLNFAELTAATPIRNYHLLLAQIATLASMVGILLVLSLIGSIVAQWISHSPFQVRLYLIPLSLMGFPLILLACVFVSLFHLCRSSIIAALLIALILLLKFTPTMTYLGLSHTFWNVAWAPIQRPDEFWGFRASLSSYWPYMRVWLLGITTLVMVSVVMSYRGLGLSRGRLKPLHSLLLLPIGISVLAFFQLHTQLNDERPLSNSHKREAFSVQYEQQFSQWQNRAQPSIIQIDAQVDFYPKAQRANFALTYSLLNHHNTAIEQVLVGRAGRYSWADVQLEGAKQIAFDEGLNQAVYAFDLPLQPGERRTLRSEFTFEQPKLWPIRGHQFVTPELSYIRAVPLLPTVGYQANYEIHDPQLRTDHQLPKKKQGLPSAIFAEQTTRLGRYDWLTLTSTITTDANHHGLSQGELLSQSQSAGRNVFRYRTNTPMRAIPAWLSMPFDGISQQQGEVTLQVFTPRKGQAEGVNLKAMADTLAWLTHNVSPYRAKQLTLVNVPEIGLTGYALPQIILINDLIGFRARPAEYAGFDQRYRRAVHETAHQWFGHDIGNGVAQDHAFLIESMAKYIELVLLETHYGKSAMDALLQHEKKRYQYGALSKLKSKVALVNATESHDQHSRATIVFAQLRERLGDEVITQALRQLWQVHSYPNVPANAMDFVRSLKKTAGKENHALIETLLIKP